MEAKYVLTRKDRRRFGIGCRDPRLVFHLRQLWKVFVENNTWKRDSATVDDSDLCLPCAAKHYIADESNWIRLTKQFIAAVDFKRVRRLHPGLSSPNANSRGRPRMQSVRPFLVLVWPLAGLVFVFQQPIKLDDKCHHFGGVFFITDFLRDAPPISRLWGHGKPPF
jgi:hypothetical protein